MRKQWVAGLVGCAAVGVAGLGGCTSEASVRGQVDGEEVRGGSDAYFDTIEADLGVVTVSLTVIAVTDFRNACDVFEGFLDNEETSCPERCEDYLEVVDELGVSTSGGWQVTMLANTSGGKVGSYDHQAIPAIVDTFSASYATYDTEALSDQEACERACEGGAIIDGDDVSARGGDLEIEEESEDRLIGSFVLDMEGSDTLEGSFRAKPCDTSDWIPFL